VDERRNQEPMTSSRGAVQAAHAIYRRWKDLEPDERERLRPLADRLKAAALDLRGRLDCDIAERELADVSMELALAIANSEYENPLVSTTEFEALRDELREQLGRLAAGEQKRAA
jgi:hypothetical protein